MATGVEGADVPTSLAHFLQGGYVVLTNYRLIWIGTGHGKGDAHSSSASGVPCHLPLLAVSDAEHKHGLLVKAARIKLAVRVDNASYPTAGEAPGGGAGDPMQMWGPWGPVQPGPAS